MILSLYLVSPFLNLIVTNIKQEDIKYFFILWLIVSIISTLAKTQNFTVNKYILQMDLMSGFVSFYLAGGFLKKIKIELSKVIIATIFFAMITINIVFTPQLSPQLEKLNPVLFNGGSITIVVATISLFILIKKCFSNWFPSEHAIKIMANISALCLGVYLIHPMVMVTIMRFLRKNHMYLKAFPLDMVITIVSVFSLSLLITAIIRKIPIIKDTI